MSLGKIVDRGWLQLTVGTIVGGLFIYAGWVKFRQPLQLADTVAAFGILPTSLVTPLAAGLPVFEMLIGVLLIFGPLRRSAAMGVVIVSVIFGVAIASAIARGLVIDCGCFGSSIPSRERMWLDFGRDVMFLVGGLIIYVSSSNRFVWRQQFFGRK